jgi:hypothetical protein
MDTLASKAAEPSGTNATKNDRKNNTFGIYGTEPACWWLDET